MREALRNHAPSPRAGPCPVQIGTLMPFRTPSCVQTPQKRWVYTSALSLQNLLARRVQKVSTEAQVKIPVQFKVWSVCAVATLVVACEGRVAETAGDGDERPPGAKGDHDERSPGASKNNGETPSLSALPQGLTGILDCPTSPYPGTSMATANLSQPFAKACAACHGGSGEGFGAYPALPGLLTEAQFIAKVRQGAANMPPASADLIDDATLGRDYRALKIRGAAGGNQTHPALAWSASEIAAKREAGMKLWRKPDKDGMACANCHSPDAIDLAVIAYDDAAVIRRATIHLSLEDALGLVDFVHAQRRHFKIAKPCSTDWRVFQPGGEPLAGQTPLEQDQSFAAELRRLNLRMAVGKIMNIKEANEAWDEMANLNTRKLRTGISLPRWTEDRFNGDAHKTINDWIPAVPRVPNDAQWHTRVDAYLADPTDASLAALEHDMEKLTSDHGYKDVRYNISGVFLAKSQAVLLASHMFRMAVLGRPGWDEMGLPPMARATKKFPVHGLPQNPFRTIGASFQENFCYNDHACVPGQYLSLPSIAKVEFAENTGALLGEMDIKGDFWEQANQALTHSWWTLAQLFDPAMTAGGGADAGDSSGVVGHATAFYWAGFNFTRNFPQIHMHGTFVFASQFIKRVTLMEKASNQGAPPPVLIASFNPASADNTDFFLTMGDEKAPAERARMVMNYTRATLMRMQAALQAGGMVTGDLAPAITTMHDRVADFAKARAMPGSKLQRPELADLDAGYVSDTLALADKVLDLVKKAPKRPSVQ